MTKDPIEQLINAINLADQKRAQSLLMRFETMMSKFRGFDDPSFDIEETTTLLQELLAFEKEMCSLLFLNVFYCCIARLYLHKNDIQMCIIYGLAALELNTKNEDSEGITAANMLLCDCALSNDASSVALEFFSKALPIDPPEIMYSAPNSGESEVKKMLLTKRRPSTFKFFASNKELRTEQRVRFFMQANHVSRSTAQRSICNI